MSRIETEFAKERESEIFSVKPKFYIFSEGIVTERKYFEKLNCSVLSNNVEIINILRDYVNAGDSNPSNILKLIDELLNKNDNEISIRELKNRLKNWGHENNRNVDAIIKDISKKYKDDKKVKYNDLKKLIFEFYSGEIYVDLSKNFMKYLYWQDMTYNPSTDVINLVVDRDNKSFTKTQYNEVKNYCKRNNVGYYVSNPCFEFWLYLHFPDVEKENDKKLLKNVYINPRKRYIEDKLHRICGYTKKSIDFNIFEPKIKDAIIREKKYEENIVGLESKLGTNVGKLVNQIINKK